MTLLQSLTPLLLTVCITACSPTKKEEKATPAATESTHTYPLPQPPAMLTDPAQRIEYAANHYWDALSPADSTLKFDENMLEQTWFNYCSLLARIPAESAQTALQTALVRVQSNPAAFGFLARMTEKYLYDPHSPMRNEKLYISALEVMTNCHALSEDEKIRPRARLELAQKNRPGQKATNFTYTLASGRQGTLHAIHCAYTLLFINNPECEACSVITNSMTNSEIITRMQRNKKLTVLSLYTDNDLEMWKQNLAKYPAEWITAYDKTLTISTKQLYDLKSIPTLYLLNKDKTVILKDAYLEDIEDYLLRTEK